ncbi:MAG: thioredoxin domain-containing protein [Candidatus Omnitrophica bacterium]|nr:thioredoxin domain-containing protein [Candidatus Omnitrophota bacterium]
MDNKVSSTILLVVIILLLAIGILNKQNNSSDMQQLMNHQTAILQAQNRLEARLGTTSSGSGDSVIQLSAALMKISDLETRLKAIETKIEQGAKPQAANMPPAPNMNTVYTIPLAHTPLVGSKDAKVTITEFMDLECPFCARFHAPIVEALKAYPNDVNYVIKNFPLSFHANAKPAAKAALAAAEQGKYIEMIDKILENRAALGEETYKRIAGEIGLDVTKFSEDLKNNDAKYEDMIQKDIQLGGQVGVRGTPSFYMNGKVTNARDFNALKTEIDVILKK